MRQRDAAWPLILHGIDRLKAFAVSIAFVVRLLTKSAYAPTSSGAR